jgi:hypothetical protein
MASAIYWYDHSWKLITTGLVDLDSDTLKIALVTSSYTPSTSHTVWNPGTDDAADPVRPVVLLAKKTVLPHEFAA